MRRSSDPPINSPVGDCWAVLLRPGGLAPSPQPRRHPVSLSPARPYRPTAGRRAANALLGGLIRLGLVPDSSQLLTTVGRRTGTRRSTPITLVRIGGAEYLVAPYGPVAWGADGGVRGRGRPLPRLRAHPGGGLGPCLTPSS